MSATQILVRGKSDAVVEQIREALTAYVKPHPNCQIVIYRQNAMSVRVRVIDPDFAGIDWADRHDLVWSLFANLPDEVVSHISVLLLLTPDETQTTFANMEFDAPTPSRL
jgi:hypothetical protein